jgi:UDP-N-acetylmuramoyl-L-alanyl-D-glutamate--2,6-diaminopimelate ligase
MLFNDLLVRRSPAERGEGGTHGKIISVFGSAGGGRDKWKRPELGKIASRYSDQIFITNEDSYDEDAFSIANDILAGCDKNKADIILDRRQAIARALSLAQKGDIVLILGKGTEQTMVIGKNKIAWDDRKITREELDLLKNKRAD